MKEYEKPTCEDIVLRVEENFAGLCSPEIADSTFAAGCAYTQAS